MTQHWAPSRRRFLQGSAAIGAAAIAMPLGTALGASYPSQNIDVVIPTREGGGADRNFRAFTSLWKTYLNTNFEPGFYPGASGRVGYEVFMGKKEANCYNLIFGNMGPEVLNWVVKAPSFDLDDYLYFGRVDTDPGCVFVGARSEFRTIDDIVAAGKKRKLNVGTSRMAHPASIGILALGEHTGARFNLIPLSGGKNTVAGAVTGEVDFSVLTSGTVAAKGDSVRTVLVFNDKNVLGERLNNAPTMNDHFGTDLPPMLSSRAFAIHRAAIDKYPDRFALLQSTFKKVFDDPAFPEVVKKSKGNWEYINYGGVEECAAYVKEIFEIGARFKALLSGKA
ncbi:MAG: twin-arginine translocation signal domain-containing protein [Proteobacteria bacterium]|nr:twin-arginine translocation signal domain-containing protein [Pseudomonadota bacterium]